jgi:L-amino acid N-acyltransferase YncA
MPLQVRNAKKSDVAAIAALMLPESSSQGGTLHGDFPVEKINRWLAQTTADSMPILVAEDEAGLLGVLFTSSSRHQDSPVAIQMAQLHHGTRPFFFYGPVCIAPRGRGQGLLAAMWQQLQQQLPGQQAVLFIHADNQASLKAHTRLGMVVETPFDLDGQPCLLLSSR